jgi:hypothetical protein
VPPSESMLPRGKGVALRERRGSLPLGTLPAKNSALCGAGILPAKRPRKGATFTFVELRPPWFSADVVFKFVFHC